MPLEQERLAKVKGDSEMRQVLSFIVTVFVVPWAAAQGESLLKNGGFEAIRIVKDAPSADVGFGVWQLGPGRQAPTHWTRNSAYPGELLVLSEGAHSGKHCVRLRATGKRAAHLFQSCQAVQSGKWYRVTAWVRGGRSAAAAQAGRAVFQIYEYYRKGPMRTPTILAARASSGGWRQVSAYYRPTADGLKRAALAIVAAKGETMDVDDVRVEEMPAADLPAGLEPIVLENELVRMKLSPQGTLEEFICRKTGVDYAERDPSLPVFRLARAGGALPVQFIRRRGDLVEVQFVDPEVKALLRLESRPHYFTFAVESVSGADVEWLQLCDLRLKISKNVGTLINAAWDDEFAACVLACNDLTHSYGASGGRAALCAKCYGKFGVKGAKVAVIGVPTGPPNPASKLLDAIEEVELEQGLPHPTINGVWTKRAPERFASYLMASGLNERNVDQVVEFAKGGFGCIEIISWAHSYPTYSIRRGTFPNGLAGLRKCADKIHAAGMQVGLHVMRGMVGVYGTMHDPYVSPKADPRLFQDRHATLAAALDAKATELVVKEDLADWPDKGDLFLEGEIVRYARRTENRFGECQRGLHRTHVAAHPAGARVGHLPNCFKFGGNLSYSPDMSSTMADEICDNIAHVFNAVGADMSYFDGGEETGGQGGRWRYLGRYAIGVQQRLKKAIVIEGNGCTHLSWHAISRGAPNYDPIYYGRRHYTLRYKGQNPARWAKNLLTGDTGWFAPHVHSPSTYAVTPDEVMLLCLKALAGNAPISFQVGCNNLYANRRMPEMLAIIRAGDELKRAEYFSDEVCAKLAKPWGEHVLERTGEGEWLVRPMKFGPPQLLTAHRAGANEWTCKNPYGEQTPWLRLRAKTRLAAYADKDNFVLADFAQGVPFRPDGSASGQLVQTAGPSAEKTPDGSSAFCYRAHNKSKVRSPWCRLSVAFPKPLDLSKHRRIGIWVHSEGKGGILNVQLVHGSEHRAALRDHYIILDFAGWAYHELDPPETSRFYDYRWPYSFTSLMYFRFGYNAVKGLNLYYNGLPPGAKASCLIGRIEALREYPLLLKSPGLEVAGQKMVFPVSLKPDEYLELDWTGKCRHFEPNGGLLAELKPEGRLRLATGENRLRFAGDASDTASPRARVTLAVRGKPLVNRTQGSRASIEAKLWETGDELKLLPGGKRGFRLTKGLYELAGREPPRAIPAFDGTANVWTVVNEMKMPCRTAIVIARGSASPNADYDDPKGLLIESFDDLTGYEMSKTNQFEKYVLGGGKQLTKDGPVRAGISQAFAPSPQDARVGRYCGVYTATNKAGPSGWGAKGKRFPKPLDLSAYEAIALWVHGDGKRETLRFQFADAAGKTADWLVPIDFSGWRLHVFRTADRGNFDWKKTEYVLFYFNGIPAGTTVTIKFDGLKALPKTRGSPSLCGPVLTVNNKRISLPAELGANEALTIDGLGRLAVWRASVAGGKRTEARVESLVLEPGPNRFQLSCDMSKGVPRDASVRVVRLGPVEK